MKFVKGKCHQKYFFSRIVWEVYFNFLQENAFQDGSNVAVILCGHKDMSELLTKQMEAAGVKKERILTNY